MKRFALAVLAAGAVSVALVFSSASGAPPLSGPSCKNGETLYTIQSTDSATLTALDINSDGAVCVADDSINKK